MCPLPIRRRKRHQAVGLPIRQGLQKDRIHYAEDRSIGADPERQGYRRNGSEAWTSEERTGAVPQVLHEGVHHSLRSAMMGSTRAARRAGR